MAELSIPLMIVLIVAITTFGRIYRNRHAQMPQHSDALSLAEAAQMKAEIHRLNDRIQVLERLAVDPAKRLSDQIAALDEPKLIDRK
ncbi:MAG: hypothetical protein ACRCUI_03065 [Polymorphobacter sp.]